MAVEDRAAEAGAKHAKVLRLSRRRELALAQRLQEIGDVGGGDTPNGLLAERLLGIGDRALVAVDGLLLRPLELLEPAIRPLFKPQVLDRSIQPLVLVGLPLRERAE